MENLNEGKKKASAYMAELAEIDKQSAIVAMEAKIDKLDEMIEAKTQRLSMVSEDENLSELIDKKRVKMMEREIKEIEKAKMKLEKLYEKMSGGKKKEIVDEDARTDAEEEGYLDGMKDEKEDIGEGGYDSTYEEDDSKEETNEEVNRWQKLAGLHINENVGVAAARGLGAISKMFGKGKKTSDEMYKNIFKEIEDEYEDAKDFMEQDDLIRKLMKLFSSEAKAHTEIGGRYVPKDSYLNKSRK
jgi:hypothetical protein